MTLRNGSQKKKKKLRNVKMITWTFSSEQFKWLMKQSKTKIKSRSYWESQGGLGKIVGQILVLSKVEILLFSWRTIFHLTLHETFMSQERTMCSTSPLMRDQLKLSIVTCLRKKLALLMFFDNLMVSNQETICLLNDPRAIKCLKRKKLKMS